MSLAMPHDAAASEPAPRGGGGGGGGGAAIAVGVGVGLYLLDKYRRSQKSPRFIEGPEHSGPRIDVSRIQECLTKAGFDPGPVDGSSGPQTRRAFRSFQNDNALGGRPNTLADKPSANRLFEICDAPDYGLVKAPSDVAKPALASDKTGNPIQGATVISLEPTPTSGSRN